MNRILIIPGALNMGGAERVAANICTYAPEGEFEFNYLVFEGHDNVYGPEIEARGGKVITVPVPASGYRTYIRLLRKLIKENRYDVVRSHTMFNSGINPAMQGNQQKKDELSQNSILHPNNLSRETEIDLAY